MSGTRKDSYVSFLLFCFDVSNAIELISLDSTQVYSFDVEVRTVLYCVIDDLQLRVSCFHPDCDHRRCCSLIVSCQVTYTVQQQEEFLGV